jgi:rubrerythrin
MNHELLFLGTCARDFSPRLGGECRDCFDLDARRSSSALVDGRYLIDCGTHTLFIATVEEAITLSAERSVTYQYYFDHIKPQPVPAAEKKTGWVCKICGYVYEGEELPADYVCPLCKHGAEDFEKL